MSTKRIAVIKVQGRGPVHSQRGTGLNAQGQPIAPVPVAKAPPAPPRVKIAGQP